MPKAIVTAGRAERNRLRWLVAAVLSGVAGAIYLYTQLTPGDSPMPRCVFQSATGLYCPGCGSGRAVHALLHARLLTAWRANPLLMIALPFLIWFGGRWAWDVLHRRKPRPALAFLTRRAIFGIAVVVVVYWIARNLPWWPCTLLAPH